MKTVFPQKSIIIAPGYNEKGYLNDLRVQDEGI